MTHRLALIRTLSLLLTTGALLSGCTTERTPDVTQDIPETELFKTRLEYGAVDPSFRRPVGDPSDGNLFLAPDLPDPTDARLASGRPGPAYWQQRVDYRMDVTLDAVNDAVSGVQRVTYHNNSPHDLGYLWIQLEQNLFTTDSIGMRARSPSREIPGRPTFEGGYDIGSVRAGGADLAYSIHDTLMRVELPRPIRAGERFEYELEWSFRIPPYRRRMGVEQVAQGKIFQLAQWFPHVCKYDDARGWNTLPYMGPGEFYTDFGTYDMRITVPADYVVVSTGEVQNQAEVLTDTERANLARAVTSDEPVYVIPPERVGARGVPETGTRTWHIRAEDVRTVTWTASDALIWDACGADVDGRRVLCQSFYPREAHTLEGGVWSPEHEDGGSTRIVKHSIEFYSDWLFPYPYPHMTNVSGPEDGMEYPMMIYCVDRNNARGLWGVTDHEVGHGWFPMVVNTNERLYMWMDEGFDSFMNGYSRAEWNGEAKPDMSRRRAAIVRTMLAENPQPINLPPDRQWPGFKGILNYTKTAYGLYLLREVVMGPERFDRAFRDYIDTWAFKSPQPADWLRLMEDAAGMDLGWFWRGWINGTGAIDFAVTDARMAPDGASAYIEFSNRGGVVFPMPYRVTFSDGASEERELPVEAWAATDLYRAVIPAMNRSVVGVEVDPGGYFPDIDLENNVWGRPFVSQD